MAKYSILVVEDEHTLRRLLEYRLNKLYAVRTASNGEEALDMIGEFSPDLIVSDIMMPKMDGFALQTALQTDEDTKAIPFIFLTAKADEQSRLKGLRTGVDDYITKPFDIEQLLSRIDRLLERTKLFQTQLDAKIGQDFSKRLMPKRLPQVDGYLATYFNNPREHGGGDLFDWSEPEPGIFFFTVGDVMGKGLQAKFYAFSFLAYVRTMLHAMYADSKSPAELMRQVNKMLMRDELMEETFASLLLMRWEPATHSLTYANAGHCRPILLTENQASLVEYSDMILGLDADAHYQDTSLRFPPHSTLISYTDGLLEQRMEDGKMLGENGLIACVRAIEKDAEPIQSLLNAVLAKSNSEHFSDDILVFWLERLGN